MKFLFTCRRTFLGVCAIGCLTYLGHDKGMDVSIAIAGIVASVAGANSYQRVGEKRYEKEN